MTMKTNIIMPMRLDGQFTNVATSSTDPIFKMSGTKHTFSVIKSLRYTRIYTVAIFLLSEIELCRP